MRVDIHKEYLDKLIDFVGDWMVHLWTYSDCNIRSMDSEEWMIHFVKNGNWRFIPCTIRIVIGWFILWTMGIGDSFRVPYI